MKLLKQKKLGRKLLSFLLTLAILVGLMPWMGLTAYAASTTVTLYANDISGYEFVQSFTKDNITITGNLDCSIKNITGPGEFTTASGKFTKIEVTASIVNISGTGWSGGTWTGDASSSVLYDGEILDNITGTLKIVFTIETADATHSVTITPGSNMTKTAESGEATQTGLPGAMTDVVYTANEGYYFPTDYSVAKVNGISVTRNSYTQITVSGTPTADASITLAAPTAKTKPDAPTTAAAVDCTTTDNNDGKLTGVTTAMEYKKSDATDWIAGTGSDISGLVPGTYYVRLKATDTTTASDNQELTIAEYTAPTYTVTYTVVNGTWSDNSTTDKTETVQSGSKPASVPTGMKAAEGYTGGSWDKNPADTTITKATTFTYTFTEKQKVATPAFSPDAGTYTEAQSVTISCATEGATIHYTTDGSEPTSSSTTYSSAISVGETTTIKAIAVKNGMTDSEVAAAEYTINIPKDTVATPTFSPDAGEYEESTSVTISCATDGATIYYTTDGTLPIVGSSIYTSPITVHESTTIKAIGVKEGMTDSSVASATYTISEKPEPGTVATPTFSPEGGTYSDPQMVSINSETSGATIYYTTDGNDPTTESATYSSAITVNETTTIKAIAVKDGMTNSAVASATFTISDEPEPEPGEETKVDVEDLSDSDISDDLKGQGYDSVESIEGALETALSLDTEEQKEQSQLVDVKLMISTDGGETWQEATLENFPEGGIDAILPYPDGTNGNEYSFSVAHMIGAGDRAGEIETPSTTNTASGISAHFNGLSPVMITWTKNSSPSKDDSKSEEKAHTHHYVWETVEATEESDGEFRYVCDICGAVQTRVPITAYYVFNKNTTEKIRKAGQGATVKIETSRWISFHKMVMEALAERPDVTLEISFLDEEYKGNRVTVTIPAGTDTLSLVDENGFVGFLYLAVKYGYTFVN